MNNQNYIDSGILELYVAGALPEKDMIAITKRVNESAEIKAEVERIEKAFMSYAALHAPEVSHAIKTNILNIPQAGKTNTNEGKIRTLSRIRFFAAAAAILLLVSAAFNLWQYQQLQSTQGELAQVEENLLALENRYNQTQEQFADIRQVGTKIVALQGQAVAPDAQAIVYWNPITQSVYVDASGLPEPPPGKEYQLWTLKSLDPLTPQDAGMLEGFADNDNRLFAAKSVNESVAFAITLEPVGGSPTPSLDQLYVLGTLS